MPTYEYACKNCGNQWEVVQKISEAAIANCPRCHEAKAERLISAGNFILKGGGWYADLYSSTKPPAAPSEASKNEAAGPAESSTNKESKADSVPGTSAPAPAPAATPTTTKSE